MHMYPQQNFRIQKTKTDRSKWRNDKSTVRAEDLKPPLSVIDSISRKKISKNRRTEQCHYNYRWNPGWAEPSQVETCGQRTAFPFGHKKYLWAARAAQGGQVRKGETHSRWVLSPPKEMLWMQKWKQGKSFIFPSSNLYFEGLQT